MTKANKELVGMLICGLVTGLIAVFGMWILSILDRY